MSSLVFHFMPPPLFLLHALKLEMTPHLPYFTFGSIGKVMEGREWLP